MREPTQFHVRKWGTGPHWGWNSFTTWLTRGVVSLSAIAALTLPSCTDNSSMPDEQPEEPTVRGLDLHLVRQTRWPGGGRELTLRVMNSDGTVLSSASASDVRIESTRESAVDFRVDPVALQPGFTALVLDESDPALRSTAAVNALVAFVDGRPAGERIALYRWGATLAQHTNYTTDRSRLRHMLEVFASTPVGNVTMPQRDAMEVVTAELGRVGGKFAAAMRGAIVVGSSANASASDLSFEYGPPVWHASDAGAGLVDRLTIVSNELSEVASKGHYRVSLCSDVAQHNAVVSVSGFDTTLDLVLDRALPEQVEQACDLQTIATGERDYPTQMEMIFTEQQRAVYDGLVANVDIDVDLARDDFELSIRLRPDEKPIVATAHIRGHGSVFCERKSYTVKLAGPNRYLFPDSAHDEFYLISLCDDVRYVNQYSAMHVLSELGLFPLQYRLIELVLDGNTRGVYLLLEKTREELVRDNGRIGAVLRRTLSDEGHEFFRVKYSDDQNPTSATGRMDALTEELSTLEGEALIEELERRFDLEQYLRWLAFNSLFRNGDYVDEVFFYTTDQGTRSGAVTDRFQIVAWDFDDMFAECHHDGLRALSDPNELLYCAEGKLEYRLLQDRAIYDRYVVALEALIERVSVDRVAQAAQATEDALLPFFDKPEICAAMVELIALNPAAIDCSVARADIADHVEGFVHDFADTLRVREGKLEVYRQSGGQPLPAQTWPVVVPF